MTSLSLCSLICLFLIPTADAQEGAQPDAQQKPAEANTSELLHGPASETPQAINYSEAGESLEQRMARTITLDVRDMSIVDVLRFLALKGDLNLVTTGSLQGRATFYLKKVTVKDALDIAVLSSHLAYIIEKDIVRILPEGEYEATYGKKFSDKNVLEIVHLKYAKPSYALAALESLKSNLGKLIIDEDTGSIVMIDTAESIIKMKDAIAEMESPMEVFVYALQYAKADVVAEKLKARIDAHTVGSITVDERTNKIIIRALPDRRKEIEKLLPSLDTPTKEVLVEARVLQVVFKPQYDLGIDWNLDFRDSKNKYLRRTKFKNIFLNENNLSSSSQLFNNFSRVGIGNFTSNQLEIAIRALKQVSDTKILSNPKLLVTNNQEAKIHVGDTIPYIVSTTSGTGDNAITSEDVRFTDVGIQLNVTPTINDDGFVTMILKPEVSTVVGTISSKGGGIPQVSKTELETTIMVKDGMTVVLGGLRKDNKSQVRKGIPGLMDVPFLRNLFSSTSESIEATEIVIFITPHIVSGAEDYAKYRGLLKDHEFLDKTGEGEEQKEMLELKK